MNITDILLGKNKWKSKLGSEITLSGDGLVTSDLEGVKANLKIMRENKKTLTPPESPVKFDLSKLKRKHLKTLQRISNVENDIPWSDIVSLLSKLGCVITNGEGSRIKINIGESVWSVHLGEEKVKFGITRELKKILIKEKIIIV